MLEVDLKMLSKANFSPCPAVSGFIIFENTVDPDQLASDEVI